MSGLEEIWDAEEGDHLNYRVNSWDETYNIGHAGSRGAVNTVRAWLDATDNVNEADHVGCSVLYRVAGSHHKPSVLGQVRVLQMLLERGADPSLGQTCSPLQVVLMSIDAELDLFSGRPRTPDFSNDLARAVADAKRDKVLLLVNAGADVNARNRVGNNPPLTALSLALGTFPLRLVRPHSLEIVATLLRAGASLDSCYDGYSAEEIMQREEVESSMGLSKEMWDAGVCADQWNACKTLIAGLRAAGSWKALERVPRKAVIVLRCLHVRGRATTADPIMKFLCELGDNGVVWNVLSYWSARLY